MPLITNILLPVDFSPSSIAMAPYVKRAATLWNAKVSLVHVFDPSSSNAFELQLHFRMITETAAYVDRAPSGTFGVAKEHQRHSVAGGQVYELIVFLRA